MQVPSILQGESLKRLLQGAAIGAVATIVVGFSWGGWSLGSTADRMAKERSEMAVVAALAPVCADKFRALPDAEAKTVTLSKAESWKRAEEFPQEFVTLPGQTYPSSALVNACYALLLAPKSAALQ
jgi:alpha/beta superfamily hydrolase